MPFWTIFWVIVPPVILIGTAIGYYILSGKKEEN
jgi:hypothetical protein